MDVLVGTLQAAGLAVAIFVGFSLAVVAVMVPIVWIGEHVGDLADRLLGLDPNTGRPTRTTTTKENHAR